MIGEEVTKVTGSNEPERPALCVRTRDQFYFYSESKICDTHQVEGRRTVAQTHTLHYVWLFAAADQPPLRNLRASPPCSSDTPELSVTSSDLQWSLEVTDARHVLTGGGGGLENQSTGSSPEE